MGTAQGLIVYKAIFGWILGDHRRLNSRDSQKREIDLQNPTLWPFLSFRASE